ncbi:hypothetical protein DER45DRAFT_539082 [Fusarium avenaceum]|nr:hypothetical protein DER45DRAFT_539082 [Fusarium avenaceum]
MYHTQSSEEDAAAIVNLGLVNIKRDLSENQERHMAEARGLPRLALSRLAQLWPLFLAGAAFCIYLALQPKPPLATPISPEFPLLPRISAFALTATNLAPTIFCNQLLHIGISDKPGTKFTLPPNGYSTLKETYKVSSDLYHYINTRILDEGVHATVIYRDMAFYGRRRDDTEELFYKTWDTASDIRSHFSMSNYDLFSGWSGSIATSLRWLTRYLENKSLVPADNMFITQGNMSRQNRSIEDILGGIKWHGVLDLPRTIAQLIDVSEQLIQTAEFMKLMPVITTMSWHNYNKRRKSSFYDITNLWLKKYEAEDPTEKIARAKELLDTRLSQVLYDVSQGLRLMHSVCDDFNGLTDFIESLSLPTNWIINEEGTFVELLQMPHPTEQITYLSGLTDELFRRLEKTGEFYSLWYWWNGQEKEKRKRDS